MSEALPMRSQIAESLDFGDQATLIVGAVRKDEAAIRAIVRLHNQRLYRIARSVLRNDSEAEDAVQQAYIHAFTHLAAFRGDSKLSTWLSRIVLNEALGRVRKRESTVDIDALDIKRELQAQVIRFPAANAFADPERALAQRQVQILLERAIDDLPEPFRLVLVARVVEEMSVEETADLLGLRPATVKTRLRRARAAVKQSLEAQLGPALTSAYPFMGRRCERIADVVVAGLARL
jgi:RNA polymerase sigma-70 factor, ECF subfamily